MGCAGIKWGARDGRLGVGGCLTEMDRGLLGGACLEWGLSGWAGQPYGNMGERQAGALRLSRGGRGGRAGSVSWKVWYVYTTNPPAEELSLVFKPGLFFFF